MGKEMICLTHMRKEGALSAQTFDDASGCGCGGSAVFRADLEPSYLRLEVRAKAWP